MASVLIADDEKNIRTLLAGHVRGLGHRVEVAADGAEALAILERTPIDVVFSDVRMPGLDGMALLQAAQRRAPNALVILMTAYATVPQAVEAVRAGAYDYLPKPFGIDAATLVLERALEVSSLRRENSALRQDALLESSSPAMQRVLATARHVAAADVPLLLTGESGTGKNVLAAAIHAWSPRAAGPFVTISCTTLAEHLLESELFGHVKGAFTGAWKDKPGRLEAAAGGTVFLDEVGELPLELQAKLLRFLDEYRFERVGSTETRQVDVRLVAATNRALDVEVQAGRFRQDLYYRLDVIHLTLPALRERPDDVLPLAAHLLARAGNRHRRPGMTLSPEAQRAIQAYPWPGNIRELGHALERAVVLARGNVVVLEDLPDTLASPTLPLPVDGDTLASLERQHVERTVAESATLEEAAARLGINVTTLWRKRKRWGLA